MNTEKNKQIMGLIMRGENFKIGGIGQITVRDAFDKLLKIDELINGQFSSITEADFDYFSENLMIEAVFGTNGYSVAFENETGKLCFQFEEGGLE